MEAASWAHSFTTRDELRAAPRDVLMDHAFLYVFIDQAYGLLIAYTFVGPTDFQP